MQSLKSMGAKLRFRKAIEIGNLEEAQDAAAIMLQGAWRSKCARRKVAAKKAEKKRLLEEGCARKLQSLVRSRVARKKVAAKRLEKQRMIEEENRRHESALREIAEEEARIIQKVTELVTSIARFIMLSFIPYISICIYACM